MMQIPDSCSTSVLTHFEEELAKAVGHNVYMGVTVTEVLEVKSPDGTFIGRYKQFLTEDMETTGRGWYEVYVDCVSDWSPGDDPIVASTGLGKSDRPEPCIRLADQLAKKFRSSERCRLK